MKGKKTLIGGIALLMALSLLLAACGGGGSPESVANSFLKSFAALDFDKAAKLATEEGAEALSMMNQFMGAMGKEEKAEFRQDYTATVSKVDIEGDKAVAYYTPKGSEEEKSLDLVKVNGKWKVDFQKTM